MSSDFPQSAPAANPVFFRTYSRHHDQGRESWDQTVHRNLEGLKELGKLTEDEAWLLHRMQIEQKSLPSGRWLWVGGTEWIKKRANFSGAYNCTSSNFDSIGVFGYLMSLAMMGCGTGAVLEFQNVGQLPLVLNSLSINVVRGVGAVPEGERKEETEINHISRHQVSLVVGDSRNGWVESYESLIRLAMDASVASHLTVLVDLGNVRPAGERLHGFGGIANPVKLPDLYGKVASILSESKGRRLTPLECCLLIDEAAAVVVAGNVRRSAGMRQFSCDDDEATTAKDNLWQQGEDGSWSIDPKRDALRMANHTRVFHVKPTREEVRDSVRKQYYSGEGAIQFAPEAIARANRDLLDTERERSKFVDLYSGGYETEASIDAAVDMLWDLNSEMSEEEIEHRLQRYGLNPCGEIIGSDYHCNLAEVHLNRLDPANHEEQWEAFKAAGITVAALLHHEFAIERYRWSREADPIVGVSFTGAFDFFVHAFGVDWLRWWAEGRPDTEEGKRFRIGESFYLQSWRDAATEAVWDYCERHGLRKPNRCTTVQPAGTKSLLTNASPGWHPPKAQRFIRRITFGKSDPVALACMDYGYTVVPSQSDTDESGRLLDDPFDPRCTEWLVEIPTEVSWANLSGADEIDISQFSALAQFDFYMQVQRNYTTHNTSATLEFRESEIEPLADAIFDAIDQNKGYISAALLARFDSLETFPRLPFEPISKERYDELHAAVLQRRKSDDFLELMDHRDRGSEYQGAEGPAGCDGDKCLFPAPKTVA